VVFVMLPPVFYALRSGQGLFSSRPAEGGR
jgi:hypothetical protein